MSSILTHWCHTLAPCDWGTLFLTARQKLSPHRWAEQFLRRGSLKGLTSPKKAVLSRQDAHGSGTRAEAHLPPSPYMWKLSSSMCPVCFPVHPLSRVWEGPWHIRKNKLNGKEQGYCQLTGFVSHSSGKTQKHDYSCIARHLVLVSPQRGNVDMGWTPHRHQVSDTSCTEPGLVSLQVQGMQREMCLLHCSLEQLSVQHWAFPREKGRKVVSGSCAVQAFRHKLRKGVIPVTPNSTYLKLLETFALTPSFSQSALYNNHRYLLCNTSRAPQALFFHLYYICNFPFFCQLLICQMQVMLQFHIILIPW